MTPIENMRIHFYGVQGSGSVFPSRAEREAARFHGDVDLLEMVFKRMQESARTGKSAQEMIKQMLGGTIDRASLSAFRQQFDPPEPRVYGGWTSCFRIETADGHDLVFDCGSGFRICAQDIVEKWEKHGNRKLTIFGSHAHYDHTEGFDQAAVCFDPRNHIEVIANNQFLTALDQNLGIFSKEIEFHNKGIQTPLHYELMPTQFSSVEIRDFESNPPPEEGDPMVGRYHDITEPIVIGETSIQPFEVFHPDPCLAFRIECNGKVFVYCTDHELRHDEDEDHPLQAASQKAEDRLKHYAMNADVLYRDGQFLRAEYDGALGVGSDFGVSRKDWGHSCIEDVVEMANECNVTQTYIGHHDPNRTWSERNWIDETLRRRSEEFERKIQLAQAETIIDL